MKCKEKCTVTVLPDTRLYFEKFRFLIVTIYWMVKYDIFNDTLIKVKIVEMLPFQKWHQSRV